MSTHDRHTEKQPASQVDRNALAIPPAVPRAGLKPDPLRKEPPKWIELGPSDQLKLERMYERRGNASAERVTIAVWDPKDSEPKPKADIVIEDTDLAAEILAHQKKGGAIRLMLSLPLRITVKGNPNSMCPCDVEP